MEINKMFVLEGLVFYGINIIILVIIADSILSFIPHSPYHPAARFIKSVSEKVLKHIRKFSPAKAIGFDFSPLVAILLLKVVQEVLIRSLRLIS
jgi:YggT family protein